jgi:hypothetical protein
VAAQQRASLMVPIHPPDEQEVSGPGGVSNHRSPEHARLNSQACIPGAYLP